MIGKGKSRTILETVADRPANTKQEQNENYATYPSTDYFHSLALCKEKESNTYNTYNPGS